MTIFKAVVAMNASRVIGLNGALPWHLPEDMKHIKALTTGGVVLMGRKTYESIPVRFRPLTNRTNIVLSRTKFNEAGVVTINDLNQLSDYEAVWVFGGSEIYQLTRDLWSEVHLTRVFGEHLGDTFFPEFETDFQLVSSQLSITCSFEVWQRKT